MYKLTKLNNITSVATLPPRSLYKEGLLHGRPTTFHNTPRPTYPSRLPRSSLSQYPNPYQPKILAIPPQQTGSLVENDNSSAKEACASAMVRHLCMGINVGLLFLI